MTPFEKDVDAVIRQLRTEGVEQQRIAARLTGTERAAAATHAHVKEATANALRRLMWKHGIGQDPATEKNGAKR